MAVIDATAEYPSSGVMLYTWEALTENDTAKEQIVGSTGPLLGSVQVVGSFGGATVVLQGSNDNSNWVTLKSPSGTDISLTATGAFEVSTSMLYIRPSASGGTSQDVDILLTARA